ncbi:hypothetical protein [Paraburkholderia fungorum]|uniref:hypothetical protein n=1 Tax=Paraburkholderia fungorum TaxID=134537 RepID=UPI003D6B856B
MARSKATAGQNTAAELTEEDFEALQHHFEIKIASAEAEAEVAASVLKAKKKVVTGLFNMVKGELGYDIGKFKEYLLDKRRPPEELEAAEEQRRKMRERGRLAVGEQGVLQLGDSADDQVRAERDGFEAGKAAKDPVPPSYISPVFHPNWMEQWHKGQAHNCMLLGKAEAILESREAAKAKGTLQADDEPQGDEDELPLDDPDTVRKAAGKLRDAGWTEPTAAEAEMAH